MGVARKALMKSNLIKTLAPIIVILILIFGALSFLKSTAKNQGNADSHAELSVGSTAADISLIQFNGPTTRLSEKPGKVFLINFWATWCEACMKEMPSLVKLYSTLKDQGFVFIPMNVDEKPEAVLPKAISELKMEFPIYLNKDSKLTEEFDVHGIPYTLIVDKNRKVLHVETGERDWMAPEILERIRDWLK